MDSQRSVSFFVDLKDENLMAHSMMVTPRPMSGRRTRSQQGERLTQSMYVRSDSQSSGVSFFVDISDEPGSSTGNNATKNKIIHSMSREEADPDLDELSEDMRVKSRLLLAQNLEQTKAFFAKLKTYCDFVSLPSYSKDELRQKRKMAENISRLMFEEEQKLKKGQGLSGMAELDKILLGGGALLKARQLSKGRGKGAATARPVSAYVSGTSQSQKQGGKAQDKPVLRRERTFDLDTKPLNKTKLVEVDIDPQPDTSSEVSDADVNGTDGQTLQMFQQQRLYHTMRLKREIAKLEKMEQDIAQKASEIGPDFRPSPAPRPSRQCWEQNEQPSRVRNATTTTNTKTTFKDLSQARRRMMNMPTPESSPGSPSWFISDEDLISRPNTSHGLSSRGSQTNHSLFRQFYEKKDKAVCVRDRPQAFFIECPKKARPKSAIEQRQSSANNNHSNNITNIIDLETDTLPEEKNLQEALRRKRPDYIEKSRTREQDRLLKVNNKQQQSLSARSTPIKAMSSSVPNAKVLYGQPKSRIPTKKVLNNNSRGGSGSSNTSSNGAVKVKVVTASNATTNAKKVSMTSRNSHALKAV